MMIFITLAMALMALLLEGFKDGSIVLERLPMEKLKLLMDMVTMLESREA